MSSSEFIDLPSEVNTNFMDMTNTMMSQNSFEYEDINDAAVESLKTECIRPILKKELSIRIQLRRCEEGKEELRLEREETKNTELSDYEISKRLRRKEQNRMAAKRFRKKNKNKGALLEKEVEMLQVQNAALNKEYSDLLKERDCLVERWQEHLQVCNNPPADKQFQKLYSRN